MKYYVIAGEASGDLHASYMMKAIKKRDPEAEFRGWGGDLMAAQGLQMVKHYKNTAFMGFVEVVSNLKTILNNLKYCKQDLMDYHPDALVLVDYPGFNMRIAEFAKKQGLKVFYYIAPQAWAWKQSRVKKIRRDVDKLFTLLPFEEPFFRKFDIDATYVGHPLMDELNLEQDEQEKKAFLKRNQLSNSPIIALFPGSRKQEINTMLPLMLTMQSMFPDFQFVIGGAPSQEIHIYNQHMKEANFRVLFGQGQELMKYSKAALITSGTATLEAALLNLPQVICYKGNKVSIAIARKLVKIKYIGLANLILDRPVITELIQDDMNMDRVRKELDSVLFDETRRKKLFSDYDDLRKKIGGAGASENVANGIVDYLSTNR